MKHTTRDRAPGTGLSFQQPITLTGLHACPSPAPPAHTPPPPTHAAPTTAPPITHLGHEGPLEACGEAGAAAAADAAGLDLRDDPLGAFANQVGSAVPVSPLLSTLQKGVVPAGEVATGAAGSEG